jgi:hypothetical protein
VCYGGSLNVANLFADGVCLNISWYLCVQSSYYCQAIECDYDGVWIGNRIYCTLEHTTRDYSLQITLTNKLMFLVTVFSALLGSFFHHWTFLCYLAHTLAG